MTLQPRHPVQQGLQQKNVVSVTMNTTGTMNTEDSSPIRTSVVWNLPAQEEASCNGNNKSVMSDEVSDITETSAVWNLPAQEASCAMLKGIGGATEAHTVQCLSAQEASCYPVRGPRYAEPQQHLIKNSSADTEAIDSGASHVSISL